MVKFKDHRFAGSGSIISVVLSREMNCNHAATLVTMRQGRDETQGRNTDYGLAVGPRLVSEVGSPRPSAPWRRWPHVYRHGVRGRRIASRVIPHLNAETSRIPLRTPSSRRVLWYCWAQLYSGVSRDCSHVGCRIVKDGPPREALGGRVVY